MSFTYILGCSDGSLYTGWTNDLEKRVAAHQAGTGSKYTRARRPVELLWYEAHPDRRTAMRRECEIKRMDRKSKLALIAAGMK